MAGIENLRSFNTMSPEEHLELSRRGGLASGAARRARREAIEREKIESRANLELLTECTKLLHEAAGSPRPPRKKHKYIYRI